MKKYIWLIPILFGLNVLFVGCDESNRQTTSQTTPSKMSDSDLEKAIMAKLESDAQLKDAKLDVDANADKNEVTISGTVPSQEIRAKAVELTKSVRSGLTINDKIDVKPAA
jgi:osmotically-inducible protein OsmY